MGGNAAIQAEKTVQSREVPQELSPQDINKLPLRHYGGPIQLIRSKRDLPRAVAELRRETVLGFDTETRPAFKKGTRFSPALLQLAGESAVYLFQISILGFSSPLAKLLEEEAILKVGIGLDYDLRQLNLLRKFKPAGFQELSQQASGLGMRKVSLRSLAASFLGFRISKGAKCSNWAVRDLRPAQIRYAATDAWASREIYLYMSARDLVASASDY